MPPVPVYTDSPIAAKRSAVTPWTAAPEESGAAATAATEATTTVSASAPQATRTYPQAQPGAVPSLPRPTQQFVNSGPPPPHPGATPTTTATRTNLPPPPKAGEKFIPPPQVTVPYPQQMSYAPPTAAYPAQRHGTATTDVPSARYGCQGPGGFAGQGEQSLAHPPGYHQDANSSELDRYQTSAQLRNRSGDNHSQSEEGIWDTAKKWAHSTGEKFAAVEYEVWKKINKE